MRPAQASRPGPSVLVIRFGAMGDVLLATPALRALAAAPGSPAVDFLTKERYVPLIAANPNVRRVLPFKPGSLAAVIAEARAGRYDAVIDLQASPRSALVSLASGARRRSTVRLDRWKRFWLVHGRRNRYGEPVPVPVKYLRACGPLGASDDGKGLDLATDPSAQAEFRSRFDPPGFPERPVLAIAPGAGRATKRWPADGFAAVGRHFASRGFRVILIGGEGDRAVADRVAQGLGTEASNACGRLTLSGTAAALSTVRLLVTNDTGVMHMASALGVRTAALFGPTTRHFGFFPFRSPAVVVERELGCRPCSYHGTERCPQGHFRCMLDISADEVIRAAERLLESG
jgi:lipopolysaccharide heptosyltransferase II